MTGIWYENILIDSEEIGILRYQLLRSRLEEKYREIDIKRLKERCVYCDQNHDCEYNKKPCSKDEEPQVVMINCNSQLESILDEFWWSNQVPCDRFEVQCDNLMEKANESEKKLVEMEMKHHVIVVEEENSKNKNNAVKESSRVKNVNLYATCESQPMEIKKKRHLKNEHYSSLKWESAYSKSLVVGAWEHLILYVKFMEFLPNKRKKKDDVFFLSYMPP
ncbi:hypothetical protein L195_g054002 [Trifolium pratense]|uniref:Uncharacterized protein n=1 Tax=Trifolium pratense TaxID=57577 RepID=A0A2K3KDP9_TRIPR|nr:hypothetical protein L195_g054002 [Trifolium pratense]